MATIVRKPLRDGVYADLLKRIVTFQVKPNEKLQDTEIALELGISRTPARQALLRLVDEGLLDLDPNRGFFVPELSVDVCKQTYPIIAALEQLALKSMDTSRIDVARLEKLASTFAGSTDPLRRAATDVAFHRTLLAPSSNARLRALIDIVKKSIERYEYLYMAEYGGAMTSLAEHAVILAAAKSADSKKLAIALRQHWDSSVDSIMNFVQRRIQDSTKTARVG